MTWWQIENCITLACILGNATAAEKYKMITILCLYILNLKLIISGRLHTY